MHRCLLILEIVECICNEFDYAEHQSPLLAMALTCRSFGRPALAALWRTIPDLTPIIKCLGEDLWRVYTEAGTMNLGLCRPISAPDVAIMKKYGRYVRDFGRLDIRHKILMEDAQIFYVHPTVWKNLEEACNGTVLFTNLRVLDIHDLNIEVMGYLSLFSTRNLTEVIMNDCALSNPAAADFSALCPNVTSICYTDLLEDLDELELIPVLSKWPNLSSAYSAQGSPEFIRALSLSPQLLSLEFQGFFIPEAFEWTALSSTNLGTPVFSVLRDIAIGFDSFSHAIQTIDYFPPLGGLEGLFIGINDDLMRQEADWHKLLLAIGNHTRVLDRLDIKATGDSFGSIAALSQDAINTLSTFTALTRICIKNVGSYNIDDQNLENLTQALPRLDMFHLICTVSSFSRPSVTIASLVHFARNCRSLRSLGLEFDGREDKIPHLSSYSSIKGLHLSSLDACFSPVDSLDAVAQFLCDLFPNLERIEYSDKAWKFVDPKYPWGHVYEVYETLKDDHRLSVSKE